MSRAVNLSMSEDALLQHCHDQAIDISAMEALPGGGTRLVCASVYGAEQIRRKFKRHILDEDTRRAKFRPRTPLW
jgi:hypothetical protein